MSPKSIRERFNRLAKQGGEAVIRNEAEWNASGLAARFGELPEGKMAIAVFNGAVQENTQSLRISGVKEEGDRLVVTARTGLLGGPPSRPGHYSYPQDVAFVDRSEKKVEVEYVGIVQPRHRDKGL